ncbi:MAG: RNA methyltransferase, partial [Pseudomonadota bacterium]
MAGTNRTERDLAEADQEQIRQPVIVLVEPQLGENIGAAARAMLNFGLTQLRLVAPRDGWPNERAQANASGADLVIDGVEVFGTLEAALADCTRVWATTARSRDMLKPVLSPSGAAQRARACLGAGERVAILFGPERAGLTNDHVALADSLIEIPANPAFASLNLGQAVLLIGYEWLLSGRDVPDERVDPGATRPATRDELVAFFDHLEAELIASGFLFPVEKRPGMVRSLRAIFTRAALFEQEIRTLRGMVKSLA